MSPAAQSSAAPPISGFVILTRQSLEFDPQNLQFGSAGNQYQTDSCSKESQLFSGELDLVGYTEPKEQECSKSKDIAGPTEVVHDRAFSLPRSNLCSCPCSSGKGTITRKIFTGDRNFRPIRSPGEDVEPRWCRGNQVTRSIYPVASM